jgi:ATP-binding cassette subfamily F protein 3
LQKELQKEQRRLEKLETELAKAREAEQKLEQALGDPTNYADHSRFTVIESDYNKARSQRVQLDRQYEEVFEKVMEMEEKLSIQH